MTEITKKLSGLFLIFWSRYIGIFGFNNGRLSTSFGSGFITGKASDANSIALETGL
jgi:hypothetical protein